MVGTAAQIERDIAALDQQVSELAELLYSAYSSYLTCLGQGLRRQLMLACYHICTQGHPDRFLHLSYNQRQQLQQTLKHLATQAQEHLLASLRQPGTALPADLDPPPEHSANALGANALGTNALGRDADSTVLFRPTPEGQVEPAFFLPPMPATPVVPPSEKSVSPTSGSMIATSSDASPAADAPSAAITPIVLNQWQRALEQDISEVLRTTSHAANRILQQADILSKALPEAILDLAATADGADIGGNIPNVMNLLMSEGMSELLGDRHLEERHPEERYLEERRPRERHSEEQHSREDHSGERSSLDLSDLIGSPPKAVVQLLAIHLNLSEIEFGDAELTMARTKVRQQLAQLRNLGRDYQKKTKERAIAAAQSAWRSSWTED